MSTGQTVKVKGPKGELQLVVGRRRRVPSWTRTAITVDPRDETKRAPLMWGMSRTLIAQPDTA